jgi:Arc/MetJ family transcription regulator
MRTTVNIDDTLLAKAQGLSGLQERNALIQEALHALIQRESAKRLAKLAGSEPDLQDIPRSNTNYPQSSQKALMPI